MIPKTIHYCWFGKGALPLVARKCITSWRRVMPSYEIVEWNEDNCDTDLNRYVREAYSHRKYAFVSDYVRLYALFHFGGIYMDTDVEVLKSMDSFLTHEAFAGFESPTHISTALIASVKGQSLVGQLLSQYEMRRFVREDGSLDLTTNVKTMTALLVRHGLNPDGLKQTVGGFTFYPMEFFCPYDDTTGRKCITQNTFCIHWFSKSWVDARTRVRSRVTREFHRVFGKNCFSWIRKVAGHASYK